MEQLALARCLTIPSSYFLTATNQPIEPTALCTAPMYSIATTQSNQPEIHLNPKYYAAIMLLNK